MYILNEADVVLQTALEVNGECRILSMLKKRKTKYTKEQKIKGNISRIKERKKDFGEHEQTNMSALIQIPSIEGCKRTTNIIDHRTQTLQK